MPRTSASGKRPVSSSSAATLASVPWAKARTLFFKSSCSLESAKSMSAAGEGGIALLEEGLRALAHVGGVEEPAEGLLLEARPGRRLELELQGEQALGGADGERRALGDE